MPRPLALLVGVVIGGVLALVVVAGVRSVIGSTTLGVDERELACDDGPAASRICVVRVERPELVVIPGRAELQVRHGDLPRVLYAADPFVEASDDQLEVDFAGGVTVRGPSYSLHWDEAEVASLGTG